MQQGTRQLAAILFTDIVGYTALMQHDETLAVATTQHYIHVLRQNLDIFHGELLNDYGDGSLCIFTSAFNALLCAIEIQKQLQSPPEVPLRIGLHIGEVFFQDGKIFGDGVNVASRIQSLGQSNTILFSKEILDKIKNRPEFSSVSLGYFEFKNVDEPMEIFALSNEGLSVPKRETLNGKLKVHPLTERTSSKKWKLGAAWILVILLTTYFIITRFLNPAFLKKGSDSIAVLYFENMSGDPSQEYFSDGITEEIISRLSMITGLKVKSRTSVMQYKKEKKSAKQIASDLGVNAILEGSLRKKGNKIRITAQLIDAKTDEHLWSENYDREVKDIFEVQSDIAQQIASKFQIELSASTKKKLNTPPTTNTEAYDLYLKAQSLSFIDNGLGGQQQNTIKAIDLLRRVLQLDPGFTEAYALLSGNYSYYSLDADNPVLWQDSAIILAKTAINTNPAIVSGYSALAYVYKLQGNLQEAMKWSLKGNELVPFSTTQSIIDILLLQHEFGKAMTWTLKAIQYDPTEPQYYLEKATIFYMLGVLDSVSPYVNIARKIKPEWFDAQSLTTNYYLITGKHDEYSSLSRIITKDDEKEYTYLMAVFYLFQRDWKKADSLYSISSHIDEMDEGLIQIHLRNTDRGRELLNKAIEHRKQFEPFRHPWHYYDLSRQYAALKDNQYLEYLNKAISSGWHEYAFFKQDPFFDFIKTDPEYKKIEHQITQNNEQYKAEVWESIKDLEANQLISAKHSK